jgi:hypothetical protein
MAENAMTISEAYAATYYYLLAHYNRTVNPADGTSLEVGTLVSDMAILEDGNTADPAAWHDWMLAVEQAREDKESIKFRIVEPDD